MSFGSQLVTLTWKNSLLKRRHLVSFCFELWLPVLLVFGFTGLSTLFDTYEVPSGWSTAKFDPQSVAIGQGSFDVNSKQVCDCCRVLSTSLTAHIAHNRRWLVSGWTPCGASALGLG